jgi:hypothetical protein
VGKCVLISRLGAQLQSLEDSQKELAMTRNAARDDKFVPYLDLDISSAGGKRNKEVFFLKHDNNHEKIGFVGSFKFTYN